MPTTVEETFGRGTGDSSVFREYLVTGTYVESEAEEAALTEAPSTASGYSSRRVTSAREQVSSESTGGAWLVTVTWNNGGDSEPEDEDGLTEYSFEVSAASYLVKQSRETVSDYPNSFPIPEFGGAINVDHNGQVQGVQWPPPASQTFSQTVTIDPARVTMSYYRQLCALAGTINDDTFTGFASGELMFLGASGSRRGNGFWHITFNFGFLPNESDLEIPGVAEDPSFITKNGWDILWVYYRIQEQIDSGDVLYAIAKPFSAYVERVGKYADFTTLEPDPL